MKIIIVDDNKQFREGLKYFLEVQKGMQVIAEAENGLQAVNLKNLRQANIIFMDIEMPEMNGINATKIILEKNPGLKIIAVTMYNDKSYLQTLIEAGFKGFLYKNNLFDDIDNAIREVINNGFYFPDNLRLYYY